MFFYKPDGCCDDPVPGNLFAGDVTQHFVNDTHALRTVGAEKIQLFQALVILEVAFRLVYGKSNGSRDLEIRRTVDVDDGKQSACVTVQKIVLSLWEQNHMISV